MFTSLRFEFVPLCDLPPGAVLYLLPVVEAGALAVLPAQLQPTDHLHHVNIIMIVNRFNADYEIQRLKDCKVKDLELYF